MSTRALIDGGMHRNTPSPHRPADPPAPPPPRRVQNAHPGHRTGSADSMERRAQNHRPLADAAAHTQQQVAAAADSNRTVQGLEDMPPQRRRMLRAEIDTARNEAHRAERQADAAVANEMQVARSTLSPAYYDQYVNSFAQDFTDPAQRHIANAALQRATAASGAEVTGPRTLAPPNPVAEAPSPDQRLQSSIQDAQRAQAAADAAAARTANNPDASLQDYQAASASSARASSAWAAVTTEVEGRYSGLTDSPQPPLANSGAPTAQDIQRLSDHVRSLAPGDARLDRIVLQAQADTAHRSAQQLIDQGQQPPSPASAWPTGLPLSPVFGPSVAGSGTTAYPQATLDQISGLVALESGSLAALSNDPLAALQGDGARPAAFNLPAHSTQPNWTLGTTQPGALLQGAIDRGIADARSVLTARNAPAWAAYEQGGASAATATLRQQVEAAGSPMERERILSDSSVLFTQIDADLKENSRPADNSDGSSRPHFDASIDNLSAIATSVAGTPAGDRFVAHRAERIAQIITDNGDVGRYDEALGLAIQNGSGAALTGGVIDALSASGNLKSIDRAGDILENASKALDDLGRRLDDTQAQVNQVNADLAAALPYANLLPEAERDRAINDYRATHADTYAQRDEALARLLGDTNILHGVTTRNGATLSNTDRGQEAVEHTRNETTKLLRDGDLLQAVGESEPVAEIIVRSLDSGQPSIFGSAYLQSVANTSDNPDATRNAWSDAIFDSVGADAAARRSAGDVTGADRQLARLSGYAPLVGDDAGTQSAYRESVAALRAIVNAADTDTAIEDAQALGDFLDNADKIADDPRLQERFQRVGLVLTIASVGTRAPQVLAHGDLTDRLGLGVDAGSALLDIYNLGNADAIAANQTLQVRTQLFGKLLGGAELILDIKNFPSDGDGVQQGLAATAMAGQVGLLFSVPGAGWVAGLSAIGLAAYNALDKTQDNPVARDLLVAGGFSPDLAQALTQYDENGYPGAFAIREGVAAYIGLTPAEAATVGGRQAVYDYLKRLTPDQASAFAYAAQGLRPQAADSGNVLGESPEQKAERLARRDPDGDGIVLRQTSAGDAERINAFLRDTLPYYDNAEIPAPESVEGLVRWMHAYGIRHPDKAFAQDDA